MTDRYMKVVFTIIALALIWLGVKDTRLEPVVSAQWQGWEDDPLAQGLPNQNSVLGVLDSDSGFAYVCSSRLYGGTVYSAYGDHGFVRLSLFSEPACESSSYIGYAYMFSEGATHVWADSRFLFSEAQLMTYAEMTQRAAAYNQEVYYNRCHTTKTTCLRYLSFTGVS